MSKTIVIGGNFAGYTAALEIKRKGGANQDVLVIDKNPGFLFIPSLIWVPLRRREIKEITVDTPAVYKRKGIGFVQAEALTVDPETRTVHTTLGDYTYDNLVIATGPRPFFEVAPGVQEYANYIGNPKMAMLTRDALDKFLQNPGPIVIGASQNAGCMGAAYEFLFNIEKWLREQGVRKKVDLTWITPENYLGHFGIDGMPMGEAMLKTFMRLFNINYRTEVGIDHMTSNEIHLSSGEVLPYAFSMIMPPFHGVDFVKNSPKLNATPTGYLPVGDDYRHPDWPNVWAAGIAVDVKPPFTPGKIPFTIPKTGYPSDETGKIVAENVTRSLAGRSDLIKKPWGRIPGLCIMDAGKKEVILLSTSLFKPRTFAIMMPNVIYDVVKLMLEKYFLWKVRNGYSRLP